MGVRKVEDLITLQLAGEFKRAAYDLVNRHPPAAQNFKYRDQLFDAVLSAESNVDEGFHRFGAGDMIRFLSIARSSAAEGRRRLLDGITRGYFTPDAAAPALALGRRLLSAIAALQRSLRPFTRREQARLRREARRSPSTAPPAALARRPLGRAPQLGPPAPPPSRTRERQPRTPQPADPPAPPDSAPPAPPPRSKPPRSPDPPGTNVSDRQSS